MTRCERKEKDEYKGGERDVERREIERSDGGGQLSFIKSIGYEPQSVSPGDVTWFLFSQHTLTYILTHIYSEPSAEANTTLPKSAQTNYLLLDMKVGAGKKVNLNTNARSQMNFLLAVFLYVWINMMQREKNTHGINSKMSACAGSSATRSCSTRTDFKVTLLHLADTVQVWVCNRSAQTCS